MNLCYYKRMQTEPRPQVGIGLFIIKDGKVLIGQRKSSHGVGEYAGPGGHLENGESFEECALRELAEEVGPQFKIKNLRFLCLTNLRRYLPKHYADVGMIAEWQSGEPKVMEPHKLISWEWYELGKFPKPLFGSVTNYVEAHKTGQTYFES
jgi:8-oxo-dGTP diphosphatase